MTREEKNERIMYLLERLRLIPPEALPDMPEASPPDDLKASEPAPQLCSG